MLLDMLIHYRNFKPLFVIEARASINYLVSLSLHGKSSCFSRCRYAGRSACCRLVKCWQRVFLQMQREFVFTSKKLKKLSREYRMRDRMHPRQSELAYPCDLVHAYSLNALRYQTSIQALVCCAAPVFYREEKKRINIFM